MASAILNLFSGTDFSQKQVTAFRRLRSGGVPQEFTEVVNVRGASVADSEIPQASFCPRFGVEGQFPTKRGSRIHPA